MIDSFPTEGWPGFTAIAGGEVIYGTHTDASTYIPKRHRDSDLYTPWGWVGPSEQNHQVLHSALRGDLRMSRWDRIALPLIVADGSLYQIDIESNNIDVKFLESGRWSTIDNDVIRIWTTSPDISKVIQTVFYLTHSMDSVLEHLARWHGLRQELIIRKSLDTVCAEIVRRGANEPLETLVYDYQNPKLLAGKAR